MTEYFVNLGPNNPLVPILKELSQERGVSFIGDLDILEAFSYNERRFSTGWMDRLGWYETESDYTAATVEDYLNWLKKQPSVTVGPVTVGPVTIMSDKVHYGGISQTKQEVKRHIEAVKTLAAIGYNFSYSQDDNIFKLGCLKLSKTELDEIYSKLGD